MSKNRQTTIEGIFLAKKERRKQLSKLPIEDKVKILVQIQKMAMPILLARGIKKKVWKL